MSSYSDLNHDLCPSYHDSPIYWGIFAMGLAFSVVCGACFIRNITLQTKILCFSNSYILLGFVFGLLSAIGAVLDCTGWTHAGAFFLCQSSHFYLLFLVLVLLIAFLERISATMQAESSRTWRLHCIALTSVSVFVLVAFILATVISGSVESNDITEFIRPAVICTIIVFGASLVFLAVLAGRIFKLLSVVLIHNNTREIVSRIRTAFIVVTVIDVLRIIWEILVISGVSIVPPDYARRHPDINAWIHVIFYLFMDYVPLTCTLFAFLPRRSTSATGRERYSKISDDGV